MTEETRITPYDRTRKLLGSPDVMARFESVLGTKTKANGFIASVINTVWLDDNLKDADPSTVLASAMKAAVLDLPVDPNLGFSWIIPYRNKGNKEAQFQIGWKGLVQLALRTERYRHINAAPVFEGERVIKDRITGEVRLNGKQTSDEIIGYVGYFELRDGFKHYEYMTVEEIHAHAAQHSKSYQYESSAWKTNFHEMAKKTLIKKVLKHGPLSIDLKHALVEDADNGTDTEPKGEVIEGEARDLEAEAEAVAEEITQEKPADDTPPPPDNFEDEDDEPDFKAEFEEIAKKLKWNKTETKATLERYDGDYRKALYAAERQLPPEK
jgi:recombination protein RecT